MKEEILDYYLKTSIFTNWGPYKEYYQSLPDDLEELTSLLLEQTIHRKELIRSSIRLNETGKSRDGVAEEYPWYGYRSHDDILLTAPAIMAELFRLDDRGIFMGREINKKVVITCRYVAVWLASILKAKGIPTRVRSGFAPYFSNDGKSYDHWIIEYYNREEERWIVCDPDTDSGDKHTDMNREDFNWIPKIWLDVRKGKDKIDKYIHGSSYQGLPMLARTLFFDFHALMGNEMSYLFSPAYIDDDKEFFNLPPEELKELDDLALLMLDPDKNFSELLYIFNNDKKMRALNTPLLGAGDHQEVDITYKVLDEENMELACELQNKLFAEDKKSLQYFEETIHGNNPNIKYYLAYLNHEVIGITGYYELKEYPEDIFIGRFGILPNFQNEGLGKRLFLDTIQMTYRLPKKYLRIVVNNEIHVKIESLCQKYMDDFEVYDKDTVIYSKNLSNEKMPKWNQRYLDIENE